MNKLLQIIFSLNSLVGANGAGASSSSNAGQSSGGDGLSTFFAGLLNVLSKVGKFLWSLLINLAYGLVKFCLNFVDLLQFFVQKLVGIDAFTREGGFKSLSSLKDTDIIVRFILQDGVLKVFKSIVIIAIILIIIFAILAIVRSNYEAAIDGSGKETGKGTWDTIRKSFRALVMIAIVPILLIAGVIGSNAVLASICNAIKGDNDLTIGGLIFNASAYNANKYREYATTGVRTPMLVSSGTEVVNPSSYRTNEDMQVLFYKLATNKIYIQYVSDDQDFIDKQRTSYLWADYITEEDARLDEEEAAISDYMRQFFNDFKEFYRTYCQDGLFSSLPLDKMNMGSNMISSIYRTNFKRNKQYRDAHFDFATTYYASGTINCGSKDDGSSIFASIIENSKNYSDYETFATIPQEYYVMADMMDYAIEHNVRFYMVNANNSSILWSNIKLTSDEDAEEVNIDEYVKGDIYQSPSGRYYQSTGTDFKKIASNYFYVQYYDGTTRAYWSKDGATSENEGATYIICVRGVGDQEGKFIPVTQSTTDFRSNFLSSSYNGPIVARGVFAVDFFPADYNEPSAISEQKVDEDGNEIITKNVVSPFSVSDTRSLTEKIDSTDLRQATAVGKVVSLVGNFVKDVASSIGGAINNSFMLIGEEADGKLYQNSNIKYFAYNKNAAGSVTSVVFYDESGRKITIGGRDSTNRLNTEITVKSIETVTDYLLLQNSVYGAYVIPWTAYDAGGGLISTLIAMENASFSDDAKHLTVAQYSYDKVTFKDGNGKDITMFLNCRFNGVARGNASNLTNSSSYVKSGEFYVYDQISSQFLGIGRDVYLQRKANLVVTDTAIMETNGNVLFDMDDIEGLYDNVGVKYVKKGLNFLKTVVEQNISIASFNNIYSSITKTIASGVELVPSVMASEMRAGLSAKVREFDRSYYSVDYAEEIDGKPSTSGTITFKDRNNNELAETFEFTSVEKVEKTTTLYIGVAMRGYKVASGYRVDPNNASYAVLTDSPSYTKCEEDTIPRNILESIQSALGYVDNRTETNRLVYTYPLTVKYSYSAYKSSAGRSIILGASINDVSIGTPTSSLSRYVAPTNLLEIKNGNVYCRSLNQYVATRDSLKELIAQSTTNNVYFSGTKNDEDAVINPGFGLNSSGSESGVNVSSAWNTTSVAEYNDFYIYFSRGKISGGLLFDLALQIPTIDIFDLSKIRLIFRFKLAWVHHYTENVLYRLQAGGYVLDYNFRPESGIGIGYLFTLGNIDPLVLVFSTALVINILLRMVWGLIARIFEIVILFILSPGFISTMPFDGGDNFGKWQKSIIEKVLVAYGDLITLNLYFVLVPLLKDVTTGLVKYEDLPTTITGVTAMIKMPLSSIFATIKSGIAAGLASIGSLFTKIGTIGGGKLCGAIGTNVLLDAATDSQLVIIEYVNRLIYILFFLVLTTMLQTMPSVISKIIGAEDTAASKGDATKKNVKDNVNKVADYTSGRAIKAEVKDLANTAVSFTPKWAIDGAKTLAVKAAGAIAGGVSKVAGKAVNSKAGQAVVKGVKAVGEGAKNFAQQTKETVQDAFKGIKGRENNTVPKFDPKTQTEKQIEHDMADYNPEDILDQTTEEELDKRAEEINKMPDDVAESMQALLNNISGRMDQLNKDVEDKMNKFYEELEFASDVSAEEQKKLEENLESLRSQVSDEELDNQLATSKTELENARAKLQKIEALYRQEGVEGKSKYYVQNEKGDWVESTAGTPGAKRVGQIKQELTQTFEQTRGEYRAAEEQKQVREEIQKNINTEIAKQEKYMEATGKSFAEVDPELIAEFGDSELKKRVNDAAVAKDLTNELSKAVHTQDGTSVLNEEELKKMFESDKFKDLIKQSGDITTDEDSAKLEKAQKYAENVDKYQAELDEIARKKQATSEYNALKDALKAAQMNNEYDLKIAELDQQLKQKFEELAKETDASAKMVLETQISQLKRSMSMAKESKFEAQFDGYKNNIDARNETLRRNRAEYSDARLERNIDISNNPKLLEQCHDRLVARVAAERDNQSMRDEAMELAKQNGAKTSTEEYNNLQSQVQALEDQIARGGLSGTQKAATEEELTAKLSQVSATEKYMALAREAREAQARISKLTDSINKANEKINHTGA